MSSDTMVASPSPALVKSIQAAISRLGGTLESLQEFHRDLLAMSPIEALGLYDEFRDLIVSNYFFLPRRFC
jgi:hypothetical protein